MQAMARILAVAALLAVPVHAAADEIEEQIREALSLYKQGNLSGATQGLQFAAGQIQQKQAETLKKVFPDPLDGWEAEEASGEFAPMAVMGGGVTASREYTEKATGAEVDIEVVTNSPMLQSVLMFMSNPMFLASEPGAKLIKIQGRSAVRKFDKEDGSGEITLVIQNRMLVKIEGESLKSDKPLLEYAGKIDYAALDKFLSE